MDDSQATQCQSDSLIECTKCNRKLYTNFFRYRNKTTGKRQRICRDCRRIYDQLQRLKTKHRADTRTIQLIYQRLTDLKSAQQLQSLALETIRELGGPSRFASLLGRYILDEITHGSKTRKRKAFSLLIRLFQAADQIDLAAG